jgi:hypothetical protein
MRQPTRPNRKRLVFVRCPVCGVEFCQLNPDQRWCSTDCAHDARRCVGEAPPKRAMPSVDKDRQ